MRSASLVAAIALASLSCGGAEPTLPRQHPYTLSGTWESFIVGFGTLHLEIGEGPSNVQENITGAGYLRADLSTTQFQIRGSHHDGRASLEVLTSPSGVVLGDFGQADSDSGTFRARYNRDPRRFTTGVDVTLHRVSDAGPVWTPDPVDSVGFSSGGFGGPPGFSMPVSVELYSPPPRRQLSPSDHRYAWLVSNSSVVTLDTTSGSNAPWRPTIRIVGLGSASVTVTVEGHTASIPFHGFVNAR